MWWKIILLFKKVINMMWRKIIYINLESLKILMWRKIIMLLQSDMQIHLKNLQTS